MSCETGRVRQSRTALLLWTLILVPLTSCSNQDAPMPAGQTAASEHADDEHAGEGHEDEEHEEGGRVTLTETAFSSAGIVVEDVTAGSGEQRSGSLDVPGEVILDPRRVAMVSARVHGIIDRLHVVPGVRVASGEPVALLFSREFLSAQRDYQRAAARMAADTSTAVRSVATAARSRLTLMGVADEEVERLTVGEEQRDYLAVRAPFSGTVLEVLALQGTAVDPGQPIVRIADLGTVYVTAEIAEEHVRHVRPGLRADVQLVAYPDTTFTGRVGRVHDELNPETRRGRAFIEVRNARRLPKPGMFATVRFALTDGDGTTTAAITIPVDALLRDETGSYVYVEVAPLTFERRVVQIAGNPTSDLAERVTERVAVLSGLSVGERIVTSGAFTLKSEIAKGSFGEHAH